jgi:hypothetical protein
MFATTTQGTGKGSVERVRPKIVNGVVRTVNIDPNTVINSDVADGSITVTKMKVFKSAELTGNGSEQNVAHGLGVVPGLVMVYPVDTSSAVEGVYVSSEGTHTSTNVVVTVTSGKKYKVVAFA